MDTLTISVVGESFTLSGEESTRIPLLSETIKRDAETLFTVLVGRIQSSVYNEIVDMIEAWETIPENIDEGFFEKYWEQKNNGS